MISIIIPTHNRSNLLKSCLASIRKLNSQVTFEVIVVDNNSIDDTREVSKEFDFVQYCFEPRTAFTKARNTGADKARGDILLFLDDDATLQGRSLDLIELIFKSASNCGMIAGRIEPKFSKVPPKNLLTCQKTHNSWSLFNQETYPKLFKTAKQKPAIIVEGENFYKIDAACGPCIAIRKTTYFEVGGFPPDTIGLESNDKNYFRKWYVGPGDSGLVKRVLNKRLDVLYSDSIWVEHEVSEFRFSDEFWFSRYFGEGTCDVFTHLVIGDKTQKGKRMFENKLLFTYLISLLMISISQLWKIKIGVNKYSLWLIQSLISLITLDIFKNRSLSVDDIWRAGGLGISDTEVNHFLNDLPQEWIRLLNYSYTTHHIANMNIIRFIYFQKKIVQDVFLAKLNIFGIIARMVLSRY
jgi:glycosyltransferase involved in cell wall biosynthesis